MHDDVSAGGGSRDDVAGDGVGKNDPTDFPEGVSEPVHGGDEAADGYALDSVLARAVEDFDRYGRPLLDQIQPLLPLIEPASRLARQVQATEAFGEDIARMTQSLDVVTGSLRVPLRSPAESAAANVIAANLRTLDQLTAASARSAAYAATARWAEQMLGSGALTAWRVSLDASARAEELYRSLARLAPIYAPYQNELLRISHNLTGLTDWIV